MILKSLLYVLMALGLLFLAGAFAQGPPIDQGTLGAWIKGHAAVTFTIAALAGVLLHYGKKRLRGEVSGNPIDYFLGDYPGSSAGMAGALAVAIWAVWATDTLAGATASLVLASGFAAGWTLDSGINKGRAA